MVNQWAPGNLQWVGMAPETTYGTAPAAPLYWIPVDSPQWHPIQPAFTDQALRGSMSVDFQSVLGLRHDELQFKTYLYLDSCFFLLRTALGVPDVKTGTGPYVHKTSVRSDNGGQPQGTTIWYYDPASAQCWQMTGAQVSDMKVTINVSGLATIDATYLALPSTLVTPPSNTPTTAVPEPSWKSTLMIGGVANTLMSAFEIDIKRATQAVETNTGTQTPVGIYAGGVNLSGTITAVYQGNTDVNLADFLTNTQPAIVLTIAPAGDAVNTLVFQMSKVAYTDSLPSGANKYMEIKGTLNPLANATDVAGGGNLSPLLITATNAIATTI